MERRVHVDPADAAPIWRQIEESVRRLVASGALEPGAVVPSVRELSRELRVNPATVAKAYQRLTDAGVLAVRRGEGTYVAERPTEARRDERAAILASGAARYAALALTVGASREEADAELARAWKSLDGGREGGGR